MDYNEIMATLCQVANSKVNQGIKDRAKFIYDHLETAPETAYIYVKFVEDCQKLMDEQQLPEQKQIEDFVSKLFGISLESIKVVGTTDIPQPLEQKIPEINVITRTIHSPVVKINGFNVKAGADCKMFAETKCDYTEFFEQLIFIEHVSKIQQVMLVTFK